MANQSVGKLSLQMALSSGQFHQAMGLVMSKLVQLDKLMDKVGKSGAMTAAFTGISAATSVASAAFSVFSSAIGAVSGAAASAVTAISDVGLAIRDAGTDAIQTYANFERMTNAFSVMMGSMEASKDLMARVMEASMATPFQAQDITTGVQRFAAYGMSAEKAFNSLMNMRNVLASSPNNMTETIQRVTLAMGQVYGKGSLMAQELNQLNEAGIGARKIIVDYLQATGRFKKDTFEGLMEKREISAGDVFAAFKMANEGRLGGLSELQAKSVTGLLSTLNDAWTIFKVKLGEGLVEGLDIRGAIRDLTAGIAKVGENLGTLKPILDALGAGFTALRDLGLTAFTDLIGAVVKTASGFGTGKEATDAWYNATVDAVENLTVGFVNFGNTAIKAISGIVYWMGKLISAAEETTHGVSSLWEYATGWTPVGKGPQTGRNFLSDIEDIVQFWTTGEMKVRGGKPSQMNDKSKVGAEISAMAEAAGKTLSAGDPGAVKDWFAKFRARKAAKEPITDLDREALFGSAKKALEGISVPDRESAGFTQAYDNMKNAIYEGANAAQVWNGYVDALDVAMRQGAIDTEQYAAEMDKFAAVMAKAGFAKEKLVAGPKIKMFDVDPNEDWQAFMEKRAGAFRGAFKDPVRELQETMGEISELESHGKLTALDVQAAQAQAFQDFQKATGKMDNVYKPPTVALEGTREAISAELRWRAEQRDSGVATPIDRVRQVLEQIKAIQQKQADSAKELAKNLKPVPVVALP